MSSTLATLGRKNSLLPGRNLQQNPATGGEGKIKQKKKRILIKARTSYFPCICFSPIVGNRNNPSFLKVWNSETDLDPGLLVWHSCCNWGENWVFRDFLYPECHRNKSLEERIPLTSVNLIRITCLGMYTAVCMEVREKWEGEVSEWGWRPIRDQLPSRPQQKDFSSKVNATWIDLTQ